MRKKDDVRKYVVRREIKKGDKTFYKSPRIQRLVTEKRLRRKNLVKREKVNRFKKSKEDRAKYDKVLSKYIKEKKTHGHVAEQPAASEPKKTTAAPKKEEPKKVQKEVAKVAPVKKVAAKKKQ